MDSYFLGSEDLASPNPKSLLIVWVLSLIGQVLSIMACTLVLYICHINRHLESIYLKVEIFPLVQIIGYAIIYGLIFSVSLFVNNTLSFIFEHEMNNQQLNILCYIISPLKVFCNSMWFSWNGLILYLLHQGIKNTKFDSKRVGTFIDRVFHPTLLIGSIVLASLPFHSSQSYSNEFSRPYFRYLCQYHYSDDEIASQMLYFATMLLPMWLIVFYTIYIYIDIYQTYTKLELNMPQDHWRIVFILFISFTCMWPTIKFFNHVPEGKQPFFITGIYLVFQQFYMKVAQGFTIFFQSLIFLSQIKKFLFIKGKNVTKVYAKNGMNDSDTTLSTLIKEDDCNQIRSDGQSLSNSF